MLQYLFLGTFSPTCEAAGDFDNSNLVDLNDPLWMLTWMFLAAIAIPEPFNECGVDEDSDLTCVSFRACG